MPFCGCRFEDSVDPNLLTHECLYHSTQRMEYLFLKRRSWTTTRPFLFALTALEASIFLLGFFFGYLYHLPLETPRCNAKLNDSSAVSTSTSPPSSPSQSLPLLWE